MAKRDKKTPTGNSEAAPRRVLLSGDFHPHLEEAFLESAAGTAGSSPVEPVFVVVPTNFLGLRLSRELARRAAGHINVRFLTLKDLARACAPLPMPGGRSPLPHGGDAVILRRLLDQGAAEGGYFAAIADRPGLSPVMLSAVTDLKEASYDPSSFERAARAAGLMRDGRRGKYAELVRIWSAYEEFLAGQRAADDADVMSFAAENLERRSAGPPGRFIVYGFYDLNPLQKRLLAARIGDGAATVFFPYEDVPAMRYAVPTLEWFLTLGFEHVVLGDGPVDLPLPPETIVLSAPGEAREAREAVRIVRGVLERDDIPLQEAAVVLRAPEVYSELFGRELDGLCDPEIEDRRLPERRRSFLESPVRLSRTRSGLGLLALAEAVSSGFARAEVMEFLSLAELDPGIWDDPGADPPVSDWNAISTLAGITSGAKEWLDGARELARRLSEPDGDGFAETHASLARPARSLCEVLDRVLTPLAALPQRAAPADYLDRLTGVFRDVTRSRPAGGDERSGMPGDAAGSRPPGDAARSAPPGENGPGGRKTEREAVLQAADGIRSVSALAGEVGFAYFCELLNRYLDVPSPRGSRFGVGGPSVLSAMSSRGLSFEVVVVPGLVEKQFPLRRRQDPVLLDAERERLNAEVGEDPYRTLSLRGPGVEEERLLFRLALKTARSTAVVTFPRLDPATARPRVASIFVLDLLEALTGEKHDYRRLETSAHVRRVPLSRRFPRERSESLTREEFDGCSVLEAIDSERPVELAYLLAEGSPLRPRITMEETRWTHPYFTRFDGVLSSRDALDAAAACSGYSMSGDPEQGRPVSATALEEYATCPFRFLVHHVLGIDPVEEPDDALEFSPLDRGSLYHSVLERFMRQKGSALSDEPRESLAEQLFSVADSAIESGPWSLAGYEGARRLERRALHLNLAIWLRRESTDGSGFRPAHFEIRFGGALRGGDDPELSTEDPVTFDAGDGIELELGGRIDRIDLTGDGGLARVIDYKTGKRANVARPLDRGRHLQLPVYLLAIGALYAGSPTRAESAEYRFVTSRSRKGPIVFTSTELDERMDDLRTAVRHIVRGIRGGMFFPFPEDQKCRNCDYAAACGAAAVALAEMKQGDPNAEFFLAELTGIK